MPRQNNCPEQLEPPVEAIKGGYWITKARLLLRGDDPNKNIPIEHAYIFLLDGIRFIEHAIDIVREQTGMYMMQPGSGMKELYEAAEELRSLDGKHMDLLTKRRIMWTIAAGHDHLRKLMQELGYRSITNADFAQYGDGGGR